MSTPSSWSIVIRAGSGPERSSTWTAFKNINLFKLAHQDPWLQAFSDEFAEEMAAARTGGTNDLATRLMGWLFAFSSIRLIADDSRQPANRLELAIALRRSVPARHQPPLASDKPPSEVSASTSTSAVSLFSSLFQIRRPDWSRRINARRFLFELLLMTVFVSCTLLVLPSCHLLYRLQTVVAELRPRLRNGAALWSIRPGNKATAVMTNETTNNWTTDDRSALCALRDDLVHAPNFNAALFDQINDWLEWLGFNSKAIPGPVFVSTSVIVGGAIVFYCMPLVFVARSAGVIRLDSMASLVSERAERRRLLAELDRIMRELVDNLDEACRENGRLAKRKSRTFESVRRMAAIRAGAGKRAGATSKYRQSSWSSSSWSSATSSGWLERQSSRVSVWLTNVQKMNFLMLLDEIRTLGLVRPVVVCSKWRADMRQYILVLMIAFLLISSIMPQISSASIDLVELYLQTLERYKQFQCQRWHPNGTLFRPSLRLRKPTTTTLAGTKWAGLFIDQAELDAYESYDGHTLARLVYMMLFHEPRHMLSINALLFHMARTILIELLSACSVLWTSIFMLSFMDKIAWLKQIQSQLDDCRRLVTAHLMSEPAAGAGRFDRGEQVAVARRNGAAGPHNDTDQAWHGLVEKRLLVTYINFELFRRQFKPFRILMNFLVFQVMIFSAMSFFALYLLAAKNETDFKAIAIFVSSCVVGTLNIYLVVASYASKMVECLMKDLTRMLALLANYPKLLTGPVTNLWRRQLLSKHDVHLLDSTKIVVLTISYQKIISFNVHLVGLWMLLFRAFGR
jgi:hypothetical protein